MRNKTNSSRCWNWSGTSPFRTYNPKLHFSPCLPGSFCVLTFLTCKVPLDLDRVWQIFARKGYNGYMSAEYEGKEDAMTGVPKLIEKIKVLCQKYSSA